MLVYQNRPRNQNNDQVKLDFLQQLTQLKNCFDSKVKVEVVPSQSAFFELHCDPFPISSTRTNHLKLDDTEFNVFIKGCVQYIFASLFLSVHKSNCQTRKNVFYFT